MADFLDTFKRRESSEGSIDDDDEYQNEFAREVINHHSDDEDKPRQQRSKPSHSNKQYQNPEERKQIVVNQKRRDEEASNRQADQKKDQYLLQGEEKAYESDEQGEGKGEKGLKKENIKPEKKDPTFVPKGSFYQHDTRGEDVEYAQRKPSDKNYKWKHDKFEKAFNPGANRDRYNNDNRSNRDYVKKDTYQKEKVMYVPKGQADKPFEEDERDRRPQYNQQRQNKNYNNNGYKGQYNKDRDRGYVKKQAADTYEYVKKDSSKPSASTEERQAYGREYVEYVPKKQENK